MSKIFDFFRRTAHQLMQIRDTPHSIAGGLAIGVAMGMTPLFGLKTLLALAIAWLSRCSKLAAVVAVTLHDVLLPIWPVVLRWQYILGFWLINHRLPPKFAFRHFHVDSWLEWRTLKIIWPTLLGSFVMGIPIAIICYLVTLRIVTGYQARHHAIKPAA